MEILFILLIILLTAATARFLSIFLHELGHGIATLFLTRQKVEIYIGSYGDASKSFKFNLRRLTIYVKPFALKGGLCNQFGNSSSINDIVIILAGPLTSLFVGLFLFWLLLIYHVNSFIGFLNLMVFAMFMLDFFTSIIPSGREITLSDGQITYNDGQLLKRTWKLRKRPKSFWDGINLYNVMEYAKAAEVFAQLISQGYKEQELYKFAFSAYTLSKNFQDADKLLPEYLCYVKPSADEYCNIGLVKQNVGDFDASILYYNRSLELNSKNWILYNNRGYVYNLKLEYEKAIHNFDMAISLSSQSAYPYNNRGLAYIKTGRLEEGFNDIQRSLQLDDKNSYAYRNLGIYYCEVKDFKKAYYNFTIAFELDKDTPDISDYLPHFKELFGKN